MNLRNQISTLLLIGAAALFAVAGWLWWQDRNQDDPPPPPIVAGDAELQNVVDLLEAQGLDVEYGRMGIFSDSITAPGQPLTIDGAEAYVFLFASPQDRVEQMGELTADDLPLISALGTPLPRENLNLSQGSNVALLLISDDQELQNSVAQAIAVVP